MNYIRDQLLAWRPYDDNIICLAMRPKRPKHLRYDLRNLITVPITSYNGTAVQNVSICLKNCQSIFNKPDEISYIVKDMDLDALVITETWLTGNVLGQKLVGDVTPAGYLFHHSAQIHKKGGDSSPWFFEVWNLFALSH